MNNQTEKWLSIVEYARIFSISDMTVRRAIKTGRIKAELRDGKYYIPVETGEDGKLLKTSEVRPEFKIESEPVFQTSSIVKSHPTPARIVATSYPSQNLHSHNSNSHIPSHIKMPLLEKPAAQASVDAKTLLVFCEKMLQTVKQNETIVKELCDRKVREFEDLLKHKDKEIESLKQQSEDLNVLVKILEEKLEP